jgi:hypothetical protein
MMRPVSACFRASQRARPKRVAVAWWLVAAATWLLTGCAQTGVVSAEAPRTPADPVGCREAEARASPLVTEWDAPAKANLEALLRQSGAVVVAYTGCELQLMPACPAPGVYSWRRTTPATDQIEIRDTDELFAKLPLGALALEGELKRSGRLTVQTTVSGQLALTGFDLGPVAQNPACIGATHVISAVSVGAFRLESGGTIAARGGGGVPLIGGGTATQSQQSLRRGSGDPQSCQQATDAAPHRDCQSPIQLFLQKLPKSVTDRGPAGTVKVSFVSATGNRKWEVCRGDEVVCKTPCERWVTPDTAFSMRSAAGLLERDRQARVPELTAYPGARHLQARAYDRSTAGLVGGITATTFGGLGVAAGVTFLAVGYAADKEGFATAGLVTLPAGAAILTGGIWLIAVSGEHVELAPAGPLPSSRVVGIRGVF